MSLNVKNIMLFWERPVKQTIILGRANDPSYDLPRQHCRLSICIHIDWLWQIQSENKYTKKCDCEMSWLVYVKPQSQLWSKICRERFVFANLLKSKRQCCLINPYQVHTCYKTKNDILAHDHNKLNLDFRWMRGRSPRHLLMSKTAQNTVRISWW